MTRPILTPEELPKAMKFVVGRLGMSPMKLAPYTTMTKRELQRLGWRLGYSSEEARLCMAMHRPKMTAVPARAALRELADRMEAAGSPFATDVRELAALLVAKRKVKR